MEKSKLVSIISPCHNSAKYIHRLMDSVLGQTYCRIEMITVDNDSKDNTADIIKSYIPKFEAKGYTLKYVHQDDLGPSAGIQSGLKLITGDYLLMPDSDDYYALDKSVETFVNKFEELSDDYAIIRCQQAFINEETMEPMGISYPDATEDDPGTLFEDCLFGRNGYNYAPINYMVKVSVLRKETNLNIYNAYNTGQQRQICLPLYYKYKTWTILEPLVCYLVRKNSVSHGDYAKYPTQLQLYKKSPVYIDSILSSIDSMPENERENYRNSFLKMCAKKMCIKAKKFDKIEDLEILMNDYSKYGGSLLSIRWQLLKIDIKRWIRRPNQ